MSMSSRNSARGIDDSTTQREIPDARRCRVADFADWESVIKSDVGEAAWIPRRIVSSPDESAKKRGAMDSKFRKDRVGWGLGLSTSSYLRSALATLAPRSRVDVVAAK